MLRLASILYSIIGTSVAGAFIVAALVTGYDTLLPILVAAGGGAIIAVPVSYLIANALMTQK